MNNENKRRERLQYTCSTCIVQLKLYRVLLVCNLKNERFSLVQDVSIVYTGPGEVPCFVHEQRRKREAETEIDIKIK